MSQSEPLKELLFYIRQHPAFHELLGQVGAPGLKAFKSGEDPVGQIADHLHRSGRRVQHELWLQILIGETTEKT